jgi:hypothetical protein
MNSLSSSTTHQDKPIKVNSLAAGYLLNWPGLLALATILALAAWDEEGYGAGVHDLTAKQ